MKRRIRVYLAGKMGGRMGREVLEERALARELCKAWGLEVYDPAEGEAVFPDRIVDLAMPYDQMKQFVSKDEFAIRNSDVLLVLTGDTPSEGTGSEIGLAGALGKPVVLVSPKRAAGQLMGFWNVKADAIFGAQEEAVEFIAQAYGG